MQDSAAAPTKTASSPPPGQPNWSLRPISVSPASAASAAPATTLAGWKTSAAGNTNGRFAYRSKRNASSSQYDTGADTLAVPAADPLGFLTRLGARTALVLILGHLLCGAA